MKSARSLACHPVAVVVFGLVPETCGQCGVLSPHKFTRPWSGWEARCGERLWPNVWRKWCTARGYGSAILALEEVKKVLWRVWVAKLQGISILGSWRGVRWPRLHLHHPCSQAPAPRANVHVGSGRQSLAAGVV